MYNGQCNAGHVHDYGGDKMKFSVERGERMKQIFVKVKDTVNSTKVESHLKGLIIAGRFSSGGWAGDGFIVYGCVREHEEQFYQAILKIDKQEGGVIGFKSSKEVKEWWEAGGDGQLMVLDRDCFYELKFKE